MAAEYKVKDKEEVKSRKKVKPMYDQLKQAVVSEDSRADQAEAILSLQQTRGNKYVQRLVEAAKEPTLDDDIIHRIEAQRGSGKPLESDVRSQMETAFGRDFSNVRIHTDSEADRLCRELGAKAFTTTSHIFFRADQYLPQTSEGKQLVAHEVTHVVQQGVSSEVAQGELNVGRSGSTPESEAEAVSEAAAFGIPVSVDKTVDKSAIQLAPLDLRAATGTPPASPGAMPSNPAATAAAAAEVVFTPEEVVAAGDVITGSRQTKEERQFLSSIDLAVEYEGRRLDPTAPQIDRDTGHPKITVVPVAGRPKPEGLEFETQVDIPTIDTFPPEPWPSRGRRGGDTRAFALPGGEVSDLFQPIELSFTPLRLTRDGKVFTEPAPSPIQKWLYVRDLRQRWLDQLVRVFFCPVEGGQQSWWASENPPQDLFYVNGRLSLAAVAESTIPNPAIPVKIKYQVERNGEMLKEQISQPWGDSTTDGPQPEVTIGQVADWDLCELRVYFLKSDGSDARLPLYSCFFITALPLTEDFVIDIARKDQSKLREIIKSLKDDPNPIAREAYEAIPVEVTVKKIITYLLGLKPVKAVPMTPCHDTAQRVRADGKDPAEFTAFFFGTDYSNIKILRKEVAGLCYSEDEFAVVVTPTPGVGNPYTDEEIKTVIVHEYSHIRDRRGLPYPAQPEQQALWLYKTEFRAYWHDGRFNTFPDASDPTLDGKGPKTPRAREIFKFLYESEVYPYVKQNYDTSASFQKDVDEFIKPEEVTITNPNRLIYLYVFLHTTPVFYHLLYPEVLPPATAPPDTAYRDLFLSPLEQCVKYLSASDRDYLKKEPRWVDLVEKVVPEPLLPKVKEFLEKK